MNIDGFAFFPTEYPLENIQRAGLLNRSFF